MKTTILVFAFIMVARVSTAWDIGSSVVFWYYTNVSDTISIDASDHPWAISHDGSDFVITRWDDPSTQPTIAHLKSIEATAVAWMTDKRKDRDVNLAKWSKSQRALIKVLVDEINILRVDAGLQPRTMKQFRAAMKAKL